MRVAVIRVGVMTIILVVDIVRKQYGEERCNSVVAISLLSGL